jgi:hypothetical protein
MNCWPYVLDQSLVSPRIAAASAVEAIVEARRDDRSNSNAVSSLIIAPLIDRSVA